VRSRNVHWKSKEIQARHWNSVTRAAGLGDAREILEKIVQMTPEVIEKVRGEIPREFPEVVSDSIFEGLLNSASRVKQALGRWKPPLRPT